MSVVANVALNLDTRGVPQKLREVQGQAQQTEKAFNGIALAAGRLATAFTGVQAIKFIFGKTAEIEAQAKSLQVLTGSVQKATQIISELQQLGAVTPFTSTELIDSAKRLQAFGVTTNEVVETTRRLADVSGATGAELQGLVTAYGQVIAKGRLQGEELLQFQERGVALQQVLREEYGLSGEEFQKALSKGQVSAEAVEFALKKLTDTGGKYANGAIAQSDTLQGKLSTIQDGVESLARRIGQVLTPALKAVFNQAIAVLDAVNAALASGRGAGFTRSVFGARQALNLGLTSQAIDNIAQGISQVNAQASKTGINQNLQALQQYQRLLQSIGPNDPNSQRAVQLQTIIFDKINQNLAANKKLSTASGNLFKQPNLPPLLGGAGDDKAGKKAANEAKKLAEELQRSVEEGDKLGREFSRQILQLGTASETERERLQIQSQYEDRALQIKDLKDAEQKVNLTALNDEIKRLETEKLRTEELKKQAAEYIKLIPIFSQFQENLGAVAFRGGPLGAGIGVDVGQAFGLPGTLSAAENPALTQAKKALDDLIEPANQVKSVASSIGGAFTDSFRSVIDGSATAQEALSGFFNRVANAFLDMAAQIITQLIVIKALESSLSIFGGGGFKGFSGAGPVAFPQNLNVGLAGFRANGGSVMGGSAYMVGEKGPELFVPGSSGSIVPNNQLGGANVVVNVDASGTNVQGNDQDASQLGKVIGFAVQQELIKQKRPGGLLSGV